MIKPLPIIILVLLQLQAHGDGDSLRTATVEYIANEGREETAKK